MHRESAAPESTTGQQPGPCKTVLLVDDEEALLRILALLLREEGYRVLTARNGRAALEAARGERVDLVVADLKLPHNDGARLIRALHDSRSRPPVLVMSSLEERSVARLCTGYAGFFRKPFDVPAFLSAVDMLAAGQRQHLRLVK